VIAGSAVLGIGRRVDFAAVVVELVTIEALCFASRYLALAGVARRARARQSTSRLAVAAVLGIRAQVDFAAVEALVQIAVGEVA
jgi:hypothetical protein